MEPRSNTRHPVSADYSEVTFVVTTTTWNHVQIIDTQSLLITVESRL